MQEAVTERLITEGNQLIIHRSQDVQALLDDNARLAADAPTKFGEAAWRLVGRIPQVVAEAWSAECGASIGSKEFGQYVRRKLLDGDFAKFRVKGY